MGFETPCVVENEAYDPLIIKQSLWDLKLFHVHYFVETVSIIKQSLWDLKPLQNSKL